MTQYEVYRKVSPIAVTVVAHSAQGQRGTAAQTATTLRLVQDSQNFADVCRHTSKVEKLENAEAPSEASLLLASMREWVPGGRR